MATGYIIVKYFYRPNPPGSSTVGSNARNVYDHYEVAASYEPWTPLPEPATYGAGLQAVSVLEMEGKRAAKVAALLQSRIKPSGFAPFPFEHCHYRVG